MNFPLHLDTDAIAAQVRTHARERPHEITYSEPGYSGLVESARNGRIQRHVHSCSATLEGGDAIYQIETVSHEIDTPKQTNLSVCRTCASVPVHNLLKYLEF